MSAWRVNYLVNTLNMPKILDNTLNTYKTAAKQFNSNPTIHPIADTLKPSCQSSFIDCIVVTTPVAIKSINATLSITIFNFVHKRTNTIFIIPNIIHPFHCGFDSLLFSFLRLFLKLEFVIVKKIQIIRNFQLFRKLTFVIPLVQELFQMKYIPHIFCST